MFACFTSVCQALQRTLPPFQPVVDHLNTETSKVKNLSEGALTRDVERLIRDVQDLTDRWDDICHQTHER